MLITTEMIMSWKLYDDYSESRVRALLGDGKTPLEITNLEIPAEDVLWCLLRKEVFSESELRFLACDFAEHVLPIWEEWARKHAHKKLSFPRILIKTIRKYPEDQRKWSVYAPRVVMAFRAARAYDENWVVGADGAAWAAEAAWGAGVSSATGVAACATSAVSSAARSSVGSSTGSYVMSIRAARAALAVEREWQLSVVRERLKEKEQ